MRTSGDYRPIGELRSRGSRPYGAQWRAYTDDPASPWGPNGAYAQCGADTKQAQPREEVRR